jgi:hypothetical protein
LACLHTKIESVSLAAFPVHQCFWRINISQGLEILEKLELKGISFQGYLYLGELYSTMNLKKDASKNLKKAKTMCQEMGIDYWLPKIQE